MTVTDLIILLSITALVSLAIWKIRRDKKSGSPCTGCSSCPSMGNCSGSHK